jgi:hypothetical protein
LIPNSYFGWAAILLAVLRMFNIVDINMRWKFAFSVFLSLYSLGKLTAHYLSADIANLFFLLSATTILIPFLKISLPFIRDAERISEASMFLSIGIIVLLS